VVVVVVVVVAAAASVVEEAEARSCTSRGQWAEEIWTT
jgi:hypothetical protein